MAVYILGQQYSSPSKKVQNLLSKNFYNHPKSFFEQDFDYEYRTRANITRGFYTFYPLFEVHLCSVTFGLMYGQYSRAVSNQERVIVARVRYLPVLLLCMYCNSQGSLQFGSSACLSIDVTFKCKTVNVRLHS